MASWGSLADAKRERFFLRHRTVMMILFHILMPTMEPLNTLMDIKLLATNVILTSIRTDEVIDM